MHRSVRARRALHALALGTATLVAACNPTTKPGTGPGAGGGTGTGDGTGTTVPDPKAVNVSLADVGLEAASMDRAVDPCVDFYQYACGGWMAANEIPADRARWGRFSEVDERNETALHTILEDARAGKGGDDPIMKSLGAFYGACMDEAAIEQNGLAGIKPLLDRARAVKDARSLQNAITAMHKHGLNVVFTSAALADFKDSTTNLLFLDSGGIGLPDRDYYLLPEFKPQLDAYRAHVQRVFVLLGQSEKQAAAAMEDVLAVETELAKVTRTAVQRRDIPSQYNVYDRAALAKLTPAFDWTRYFKELGHPTISKASVTTPEFFTGVAALTKSVKPQRWIAYLTLRLIDDTAENLPKAYQDEAFALAKALTGVEEQRERYKRCVDATDVAMPEALGQPYISRMFPGDSKQSAITLVAAIAKAFEGTIAEIPWMSPETKASAKVKLGKLSALIGYPDTWRTYDFAVGANYAANALAARAFEAKRQLLKAGTPVDRDEWLMPAYIVNAYYNPTTNNTGLPAGILQPPFFGADRSIAANLGGIGMVVGHELTHGFDDQGALFDEAGNMRNWWQDQDKTQFEARGTCVADQYSGFEVLPGKKINGRLTLGENIADLGGVKLSFHAYRNLRADADKHFVADGLTEDQQFFVAVAQAWCTKDRDAETIRRLTVDPHSPPRFRVYGALRNLPEFATAYSCAEGTPMHPANACSVW